MTRPFGRQNRRHRHLLTAACALFCLLAGCSQYIDPNVPEPIRPVIEPESSGQYLLYRPSAYDRRAAWPLIVVCHASFPDSPNKQIREWTVLAEQYGFLLTAPRLKGTKSLLARSADEQIILQREDERHILDTIRHIRAGHNVSDDRVFIYGFSGGAYAALYTGLSNPDVFRAVSVMQPRFNADYLAQTEDRIDRYQPVYVNYSADDALRGKHGRRCAEWLRSGGADLREDSAGPARRSDTQRAVEFFERIIRNEPWIRIRAFTGKNNNPLEMQFKLRSSFQPTVYRWEFGDGLVSPLAEPTHVYDQPGTYRVTVIVDGPKGRGHRRSVDLKVPQAAVHPVPMAEQPDS